MRERGIWIKKALSLAVLREKWAQKAVSGVQLAPHTPKKVEPVGIGLLSVVSAQGPGLAENRRAGPALRELGKIYDEILPAPGLSRGSRQCDHRLVERR